MKGVELYAQVRYAVRIEGLSRREAARRFGIDRRTVAKMLAFSVPPSYRRIRPPARPKLDAFSGSADTLVTLSSGHLVGIEKVQTRLLELSRHLPEQTEWYHVKQPEDPRH
jgi:hypothetical protein